MVHAAAGLTNLKSEMEHGSGFDADGYRVEASSNISCENSRREHETSGELFLVEPSKAEGAVLIHRDTAEIGRANARASKKLFIKLSIEQ
jgi:hypothetical protein